MLRSAEPATLKPTEHIVTAQTSACGAYFSSMSEPKGSVATELCGFKQLPVDANFLLKRSSPVRNLGAAQPPLLYARGWGGGGYSLITA